MDQIRKEALVKGLEVDEGELALINRRTQRELGADEVFAYKLAACDNQVDRDLEAFSDRALDQMAQMFPGRPVLLDHNWSAKDQVARIYAGSTEDDPEKPGRKRLILRCYVPRLESTKDFIEQVDTGLRKECSVGLSVKNATCSICGQGYYDSCLHVKGQEYDGRLCYVVLDDVDDVYETSMVAVPAQREAGTVKSAGGKTGPDWAKGARMELGLEEVRFGALRR